MVQLFTDIGPLLTQYKKENARGRQTLIKNKIDEVQKLSELITSKNQAKAVYRTLAYTATLLNYADVLQRMENQLYFDILFDFYNMEMDEELNSWFEFGKKPGQMRLKHALPEYTPKIWKKFRKAQKNHLEKTNISEFFDLDQLDIDHPPKNQLYPIQIQMGGRLENEAVDRINVDVHGRIPFAQHHGFYLLPGGGMVEHSNGTIADWQQKILEEHLEEEHANLYLKAAELYGQIPVNDFNKVLKKIVSSKKVQSLPSELRNSLKYQILSQENNAIRLEKMIFELDRYIEGTIQNKRASSGEQTQEQQRTKQNLFKSLVELRAQVQVQPFILTPLFSEALDYIRANSVCVDIQQYLDTRVLGGSQISHSFLMSGLPLEEWFVAHFSGTGGEFGDDISASVIERLSLLDALFKYKKIKFSHVLIGLAAYEHFFDNGTLVLENIWNGEQFHHTRQRMLEDAALFLKIKG